MYIYVDEQVHMDDFNSLLVYVVCCVGRSKHKEPSLTIKPKCTYTHYSPTRGTLA